MTDGDFQSSLREGIECNLAFQGIQRPRFLTIDMLSRLGGGHQLIKMLAVRCRNHQRVDGIIIEYIVKLI